MHTSATPKRTPRTQGFTIVEVMISLVIVVLMLGGLIEASRNKAFVLSRLQEKLFSQQVAFNELAKMHVDAQGNHATKDYDKDMVAQSWFIEQTVEPTLLPNFHKVTMQVGIEDNNPSTQYVSFIVK